MHLREQRGSPEQVGHADTLRLEHRHACEVSEGERRSRLLGTEHYERRARLVPILEQVESLAGLGDLEGGSIQHRDGAAPGVQGKRTTQRGTLLLAVDLESVGTGLGTEHDSAACPQRRATGSGARAARALLAPGLGATAGDQPARLGGGGAAPARSLLGTHTLVNEWPVEDGTEGCLVELHLLGGRGS
jgi:hypothetical protein